MNPHFDPLAATVLADPYPEYSRLVRERPFAYDADLGLWVAASAAAVEAALHHPALRVRPVAEPVPRALVGTSAGEVFARLVRMNDGARHDRMKSAISGGLGAAGVVELRRHAGAWAPRVLAAVEDSPADDGARVDRLAFRLPALALGAWLGIDAPALPGVAEDAAALAGSFAPGATLEAVARGSAAADRLAEAIEHLLAAGRAHGPLRAAAAMHRAEPSSGELAPETRRALVANAVGFFTQAFEATAGLIGNTLLALAREPAARAFRERRDDLSACVAEVARFDPSVHNTRRFAAEPCQLLDQSLAAGDAVLVVLAAANRDPAANPEPDRFDPHRAAPRLFTFGAGGHACPGAAAAATLATAAIDALHDAGVDLDGLARRFTYRTAQNTRIPRFGGGVGPGV